MDVTAGVAASDQPPGVQDADVSSAHREQHCGRSLLCADRQGAGRATEPGRRGEGGAKTSRQQMMTLAGQVRLGC